MNSELLSNPTQIFVQCFHEMAYLKQLNMLGHTKCTPVRITDDNIT